MCEAGVGLVSDSPASFLCPSHGGTVGWRYHVQLFCNVNVIHFGCLERRKIVQIADLWVFNICGYSEHKTLSYSKI